MSRLRTSIPGPKSLALMERRQQHVARGPFHVTPIFVESAHGSLVIDVDGNEFIDLTAGIGVVNTGHTPETLVSRIRHQAEHLLHSSFNVAPYAGYVEVCEKLNQHAPGPGLKKSFLANSGAEAVENAVKIARAHTQRDWVVCFDHAFHGRTFMAMALTAKEKPYKWGVGRLPNEIMRVPFPYAYRWKGGENSTQVTNSCFETFEKTVAPMAHKTAAVIIEPVLGEGGFIPAPPEFLAKVAEFCRDRGIVLIADEIQSGFGRTGSFFASTQLDFIPDLVVTAKGLAGGMPLSAVTGSAEIMDSPVVGMIGGTFGGNPVSCAAALGVFEMLENSDILEAVKTLGKYFENRLAAFCERFEHVGDARGMGLMRAIELVKSKSSKEPFPEATKRLQNFALKNGVLLMNAGTFGNVIRFLPPLTLERNLAEEALDVVESGLIEIHR